MPPCAESFGRYRSRDLFTAEIGHRLLRGKDDDPQSVRLDRGGESLRHAVDLDRQITEELCHPARPNLNDGHDRSIGRADDPHIRGQILEADAGAYRLGGAIDID